jgi:hypothetical protein
MKTLPKSVTYTQQQGPKNICSHITTVLTTHRYILFTVSTTVTLASMNNALPDDGVTAQKQVGAVLMSILILFLRQFTCASVGE